MMGKNNTKNRLIAAKLAALIVTVITVILDQITKYAASSSLVTEGESVVAIPKVLRFTLTFNEGATAGMLSDHRWVFMSVSTIFIIGIALYVILSKEMSPMFGVAVGMIAGGGIGNMIDRTLNGKVVDFFDVTIVNFFPFNCIFNVADVFVCVGCALAVVSLIVDEVREAKNKKEMKSAKNVDETRGAE